MELRIKVTKDVLRRSLNCTSDNITTNCAISTALRDIFPEAETGLDTLFPLGCGEMCVEIPLPQEARFFINQFDKCFTNEEVMSLNELEFSITIPEEIIQTIDITEVTKLLQDHPTLQLV